jgi:hydrogenase maturation protease
MHKIAVLGIGNILMTDDGVGVEAAKQLMEMPWPDTVEIYDVGTAIMNMLDVFVKSDSIIIIDALQGGHEPGSIYKLTPEQLGEWQPETLSLHDVQVLDIAKMAELFGRKPEIVIFGIEPHIVDLHLGLSEVMQARLPALVDHVRQEIANRVEKTYKEQM